MPLEFDEKQQKVLDTLMTGLRTVRMYHRHEVVGLENVPKEGACLLVANHSLATYDLGLLGVAIHDDCGRLARALVDRMFYRVPLLGDFVKGLGWVQGSPDVGLKLLEDGELVSVAPGGMREALRPSTERYRILWDRRMGFAKLSIKAQAPIILAACPKADDLFDVYESNVTKYLYKQFKVPVFLARGLGLTILPRPVKLVHYLSEPIYPPLAIEGDKDFDRKLKAFHRKLVKRMQDLISFAIQDGNQTHESGTLLPAATEVTAKIGKRLSRGILSAISGRL